MRKFVTVKVGGPRPRRDLHRLRLHPRARARHALLLRQATGKVGMNESLCKIFKLRELQDMMSESEEGRGVMEKRT